MTSEQRKTDRALIEEFFRNLSFLKALSPSRVNQLAQDFTMHKVRKSEVIFYQSDPSTDLYIIIHGAVKASLLNEEGQELVLANFRKGDFFGEMSLLDGRPRSATVIAAEDSVLAVLKREKFIHAIRGDPMIAIELLSALVQRLRMTDEMVESIAFLDVGQRLLRLFHQMAETEGDRGRGEFFRVKKLTHRELAARTGASREAVSKAMKVLCFRNMIQEGEGCFLISRSAKEHVLK